MEAPARDRRRAPRSGRLTYRQLWIQNAGLALLVAGWLVRPWHGSLGPGLLVAGALVSAFGLGIFVAIAWRLTDAGGGIELRPPGR